MVYDTGHQEPGLCDNLEGWSAEGGGKGVQTQVCLCPIHTNVWQKPSQCYSYPPVKINKTLKNIKIGKFYIAILILKVEA